jgi:hypothetical protein
MTNLMRRVAEVKEIAPLRGAKAGSRILPSGGNFCLWNLILWE